MQSLEPYGRAVQEQFEALANNNFDVEELGETGEINSNALRYMRDFASQLKTILENCGEVDGFSVAEDDEQAIKAMQSTIIEGGK